ncbi:hypothetical protein [Salinibius halmophilus]|uniref:hypothetical protein n=1 Tax=Salinibius halmophilus TaxID=1853216 RepID=UPI000E673C54|nr:hypothetical protein [Salinibius halmophilus]
MKRWLLVFLACLSAVAIASANTAESGSWKNTDSGTVLHLLSSGQLLITNDQEQEKPYYGQTWRNSAGGLEVTYLTRDNRSTTQSLSVESSDGVMVIGGNTPLSGRYERSSVGGTLIHVSMGRYRGPEDAQFATIMQYNVSNEIVSIDHFDIRNINLPQSFSVLRPTESVRATVFLSNSQGAFAYSLGSTNSNTLRLLAWSPTEATELETLYYGDVIEPDGTRSQVRLHLYDNGQFSRFTRVPNTEEESADEGNYQRDGATINLFSFAKPPTTLRQVGRELLTVQAADGNFYMGQYANKLNAFPLDGPLARFDGIFFPRPGENGQQGQLNLISCSNGQLYTLVPNRTVQRMIGQFQADPSRGFIQVPIRAHRVPRDNGTDDRFWVTDWYQDQAPSECGRGMQTFGRMMAEQGR